MRAFFLVLLMAGLLGTVGCGDKKEAVKQDSVLSTTTETDKPLVEAPSKPLGPKTFEPVPVPPGTYDIARPGEKGWRPAVLTLGDLGKKMDEAMRNNRPTNLEVIMDFDDPEYGSMRTSPTLLIEDKDTFRIIYALPSDKGEDRRLIGDGKRRVMKKGNEWKHLKPFGSSKKISSKEAVTKWPVEFPALMFSLYSDGADIWTPLLRGWMTGEAGYKATVEEQTFVVGGKSSSHYRIVARKGGDEPVDAEVIVDTVRLLPLTIRVTAKRKGGKELQQHWTGNWRFGGKYEPKEFLIPVPAPQT